MWVSICQLLWVPPLGPSQRLEEMHVITVSYHQATKERWRKKEARWRGREKEGRGKRRRKEEEKKRVGEGGKGNTDEGQVKERRGKEGSEEKEQVKSFVWCPGKLTYNKISVLMSNWLFLFIYLQNMFFSLFIPGVRTKALESNVTVWKPRMRDFLNPVVCDLKIS